LITFASVASKAPLSTLNLSNRSNRSDVFRLRLSGLAVLAQLVVDLSVSKNGVALYSRHVDEHICPTIVGRDEAETFILVEKLYRTGRYEILVR